MTDYEEVVRLRGRLAELMAERDHLLGSGRIAIDAGEKIIATLRAEKDALSARCTALEQERDHEAHEKETVADAAKAHAEWCRREIATLRAEQTRLREALETMRAALEILDSGGGLGYAKHSLIAAALSSTPTPEHSK